MSSPSLCPSSILRKPNLEASSYALYLAATEVGIGSVCHSLHLPLTGQFLSLHQIFLLSAMRHQGKSLRFLMRVSLIAASLKISFGFGKRLTPVVAILVQSLLYGLGSKLHHGLGAALSGMWGLIQPLLVFTILAGGDFSGPLHFWFQLGRDWGVPTTGIALSCFFLKFIASVAVSYFGAQHGAVWVNQYEQKFQLSFPAKSRTRRMLQSFSWVSVIVLGVYYWHTNRENFYLYIIRTVGILVLIELISRWCIAKLMLLLAAHAKAHLPLNDPPQNSSFTEFV